MHLFVLLENECHKLDIAMLSQGSDHRPSYEKYVSTLQQQIDLEDEQHSLQSNLQVLEQLLMYFLTSAGVLSSTNPLLLLDLVGEIQNQAANHCKINSIVVAYAPSKQRYTNRTRS